MLVHISKYREVYQGGIERCVFDLLGVRMPSLVLSHGLKNKRLGLSRRIIVRDLFRLTFKPLSVALLFGLIFGKFKHHSLVVHSPTLYILALALLRFKCRSLYVFWHADPLIKNKMIERLFEYASIRACKKADLVIVTSRQYIQGSRVLLALDPTIIKIVPLGVEQASAVSRSQIEQRFHKTQLISVGRLVEYKGLIDSCKVLELLPSNFKLLIVGQGPQKEILEKYIADRKLSGRVTLVGSISEVDLKNFLNESFFFLFPSIDRREAYGLALAEALSVGLPSISRDIQNSGVNFVNGHEKFGFKTPSSDFPVIAANIILSFSKNFKEYTNCTTQLQEYSIQVLSKKKMCMAFEEVVDG